MIIQFCIPTALMKQRVNLITLQTNIYKAVIFNGIQSRKFLYYLHCKLCEIRTGGKVSDFALIL